jgi:uncharacterized protein (UPF0333 family)
LIIPSLESKGKNNMRFLFSVAVLLLAVIVCVGFYQGWFHVSSSSVGDTSSATISVDKDKIHADEQKAKDKVSSFGQKAKE